MVGVRVVVHAGEEYRRDAGQWEQQQAAWVWVAVLKAL
jgi:hypothetical protein